MKNITMKRNNLRLEGAKNRQKLQITAILISLAVLTGCGPVFQKSPSEKVKHYQANFEVIGNEKDEMLDNFSETLYETGTRDNTEAKEVIIDFIDKSEEFSVPSGRYEIKGDITGNVYIYDGSGELLFHDILGSAYGVSSITVDLTDAHTIHVDGLDYVSVIPVPTQLTTELSAGIWEVGIDIEPGNYTITGPHGGFGYLQIFDPIGGSQVFEVISTSTESNIHLKEGQILRITGISMIHFKSK
ncbi:hypothetical protein QGM71_15320 [Virgibacillus sp. C22-A2]|uniref:Uncharacterized protein n=1 Tax=Virgibacillus tibetensis TaxID=3042313 RepID=A0ABU6KI10_9BACI|nr:hypothetical protein [Virgibacillus sp. C22-A2]